MTEFVKSLSNIIVVGVTILGVTILSVIVIFFEEETVRLSIKYVLGFLALLFFIAFISLIIHNIKQLEKRFSELEKRFIIEDELIDIKKDIEAFKLLKIIKK